MRLNLIIALLSLAVSGCNSPTSSSPAHVAPTNDDWLAAFSRLSPAQQTAIKRAPVFIEPSAGVDGAIFHMTGTGLTQELITAERLDIGTICDGFNHSFGRVFGKRWSIVSARSYEQIGAPSGVQKHRFQLDWSFRDSTGKTIPLSAMDFGPGVKVIWGAPRTAVDAEMNQACALTFLELVAQLEKLPPSK